MALTCRKLHSCFAAEASPIELSRVLGTSRLGNEAVADISNLDHRETW
jgi:hypothetical protein